MPRLPRFEGVEEQVTFGLFIFPGNGGQVGIQERSDGEGNHDSSLSCIPRIGAGGAIGGILPPVTGP